MADSPVDRIRKARLGQRARFTAAVDDVRLYRNLLALMPYTMPRFHFTPPPAPLPEPEPAEAPWWPVRNGIRIPPPDFRPE